MLPFEFLIPGPAVSQQVRRRERRRAWLDSVRRRAEERWGQQAAPLGDGPICLALTYLHDAGAPDLDNLAKPVLDALKGLVFVDDGQVTDLVLRKRNLSDNLRVSNPSPLLSSGFDLGSPFMHVFVDIAPDQELVP